MADKYTVKSGDTLSKIASEYGIRVGNISGYSSGNPNLIFPGEQLTLSGVGGSINASDIKSSSGMDLPSQSTQQATGTSSLFSTKEGSSINDQVEKYRKQIEDKISSRKSEVDKRIEELRVKEEGILENIEETTSPFREDLENAERERLYINENFESNQELINELDTLLTEGNNLIRQQQEVTGLAAVRNPRIQKTMDDVAARAGVIEAVINARNGQIAVAEGLIDRSIAAIAQDRQDQLAYYETILNLNRQDIIDLDDESEKLADAQLNLIKNDLSRAEATADYIKQLLVDPSTAALMGEAGVSLNDSVEAINGKLKIAQHRREVREFSNEIALSGGTAVVDPSTVPANQLITYTDASGNKHYYKMPVKSGSGSGTMLGADDPRVSAYVRLINNGQYQLQDVPADIRNSVAAALGQSMDAADLSFEEYLDAAQATASMSFGPSLVDELRQQYDELIGSSASFGGHNVSDWVNGVTNEYVTVNQVPEEIRAEVLSQLNSE